MNENKHTPEPWEAFNGYLIRHVVGDYAAPIAEIRTPYRPGIGIVRGEYEQQANARRIVACVNACKRFPIEVLEAAAACGGMVHEPVEELLVVRKQRDELLAFAEEVRRTGDTRLASMAIAAISRVEDHFRDARKMMKGGSA